MNKTGVAIIGCGAIFPVHADVVSAEENTELLLVVDTDEEKAKAAALKYGCGYNTDYTSILDDQRIGIVHLCTPHHLHAPMAIRLLQAGKHVLTEKPMGIDVAQCLEMVHIAKETGCYLGVCFQNRYHDTSMKMKQVIQEGSLGKVLGARAFLTWSREKEYYQESPWRGKWKEEGGSLLVNQAIHTLDLLQWFMGDIQDAKGQIATHFLNDTIETEDTAEALIRFQSGARAIFYGSNAYVSNAPVYIEVQCEKGSLVLNESLQIRHEGGIIEQFYDRPAVGSKSYWGTGHRNLILHFYKCIQSQTPFPVDGREGMKALEIIQRIYQSQLKTITL